MVWKEVYMHIPFLVVQNFLHTWSQEEEETVIPEVYGERALYYIPPKQRNTDVFY